MHEQFHLKWFFQIKQVKSEQGWGRPEFHTRCLLLIYSLVKQARASLRKPLVGAQFPMLCTSTKHTSMGLKGKSKLSEEDCPTDAAESLTSSRAQQPPATQVHLLEIGTYVFPYTEPKETQHSSATLVIPETSTKWLLIEQGMEVHFFFSLVAWQSRGSPNPQMCFARSPALLLYKLFSLKASIRSGPWPKRFITGFLDPRGD